MMHNAKILTIEDDPALLRLVQYTLAEEGMDVSTASNGRDGLRQFYSLQPELVILDLMMPEMDGWETCRRIREMADVPIMMLTARGQDEDMVRGLDIGADDYMVKPFALQELEARIQVLVRRSKPQQARVLQVADLAYNLDTLVVTRQGKSIQLNPIALKILQCLMEASPSVVTRQELEMRVWGEELPDSDSLRVHIHTLRAAIDKPFDKPLIQTRHGIGYRLVDPEAAS